ncbi:MAG: hypothetical protein P8X73_15515 [Ignavibacteriaceae bacterium]
MKNTSTLTILSIIVIIILSSDIFAIPAFARKYNMSCKTCHEPFPKLMPYGNEFAGNGFQLKDKDAPRYYVNTGDDYLSLIRDVPLAMRLEGYVTYNQGNAEQADFTAPIVFKLLSGGTITKDIAYYVYYILESGEPGKIEDAWLMFNNLFSTELDFSIGQFQVSDPLFKRELRLTKDDYYIYKVQPGNSDVDLTYDRGIMLAYGFDTGTSLTLEVVNGNGIGEAFISGDFDNDKYKNPFLSISQDVNDNLRVGAMGYAGTEEKESFNAPAFSAINDVWMIGADATIDFTPLQLNVQYVFRNDNNPYFYNTNPDKVETQGGFAELIFRPDKGESHWYGVALFNWIDSYESDLDLTQLTLHGGYLMRRNIRLVLELTQNFTNEYAQIELGFVTAF